VHVPPIGASVAQVLPLQPYWQVDCVPATHVPLLLQASAVVNVPPVQDWAAPHANPTDLLPLFTQVEAPVEHEVDPFSQGLPVLHDKSGVQLLHAPLWQ
jgi:hypothetical protein